MSTVQLDDPQTISHATAALEQGGVLIYPTETVYGIGCDAANQHAVNALYAAKQMNTDKPLLLVVASLEMAQQYGEFSDHALSIATQHWPGPLTIIVPVKSDTDLAAQLINQENQTIGLRFSSHPFVQSITKQLGRPIVSTSANIHGKPIESDAVSIMKQFASHKSRIDLVVDAGSMQSVTPSTLVSVIGSEVLVLRQGDIVL